MHSRCNGVSFTLPHILNEDTWNAPHAAEPNPGRLLLLGRLGNVSRDHSF